MLTHHDPRPSANAFGTGGSGLGESGSSGSVRGYGNPQALIISGGCDRTLIVSDASTGVIKHRIAAHRSTIRCLRVFEGKPIAVSGSRDATLSVVNIETGEILHTLRGHQNSVRCIDLYGDMIASGSYDATARLWDVNTGECLQRLEGHHHQLYSVTFACDGKYVVTASLDTTIRVWNVADGQCVSLIQAHSSLVGQLAVLGSTLFSGASDARIAAFDLETMKVVYQLQIADNSITALSVDDKHILTSSNDGRTRLLRRTDGKLIRELCEPADQVWRAVVYNDQLAVACKRNGRMAIDVVSFLPLAEEM